MVDVPEYTGSSKVMTLKNQDFCRESFVFYTERHCQKIRTIINSQNRTCPKNQVIFKSFPKSRFTYAHISNGASCSTFVEINNLAFVQKICTFAEAHIRIFWLHRCW